MVESLGQNVGKVIHMEDVLPVIQSLEGQAISLVIRGVSSLYGSREFEKQPLQSEFNKIKMEVQIKVKFEIL